MSRRIIQVALAVFSLTAGLLSFEANAYASHDLDRVVRRVDESGRQRYELDLGSVNAIIDDFARHAGNYPPRFSDENARKRAVQDASRLSGMLDILVTSGQHAGVRRWQASRPPMCC